MKIPPSVSKPLALIRLLQTFEPSDLTVVFTSSVDSAHRLCRLLQLMGGTKRSNH